MPSYKTAAGTYCGARDAWMHARARSVASGGKSTRLTAAITRPGGRRIPGDGAVLSCRCRLDSRCHTVSGCAICHHIFFVSLSAVTSQRPSSKGGTIGCQRQPMAERWWLFMSRGPAAPPLLRGRHQSALRGTVDFAHPRCCDCISQTLFGPASSSRVLLSSAGVMLAHAPAAGRSRHVLFVLWPCDFSCIWRGLPA